VELSVEDFLKAGIQHYPDAYKTVERFKAEFRERIKQSAVSAGFKIIKTSRSHGYTDGLWLGSLHSVKLSGQEMALDVSLWWSCPLGGGEIDPVLYAAFDSGPYKNSLSEPPSGSVATLTRLGDRGKCYLWLDPLRPGASLKADLLHLLEVLKGSIPDSPPTASSPTMG